MSCGQISLRELGVEVATYYASEVDKHAIAQTQLNFPETIQLGDVEQWRTWSIDWASVDLLLAGSPCQGFSLAGKMLGHDDPRSRLYWVFLEILRHVQSTNPSVKYLLENVRMRPSDEQIINESLGISPVVINSALVSAQNRVRLYWSNIRTREDGLFGEAYTDIPQPVDRGIVLRDILEEEVDDRYYIESGAWGQDIAGKSRSLRVGGALSPTAKHAWDVIKLDRCLRPKAQQGKSSCLTAGGNSGGNHSDMDVIAILAPWLAKNYRDTSDKACSLMRCSYKSAKSNGMTVVSVAKSPCIPAQARNDGSGQPCSRIDRVLQVNPLRESGGRQPYQQNRVYDSRGKYTALMTNLRGSVLIDAYQLRRLTPAECARLQTIPDWYRWECSDTQAYKMLGNGWTVEVIKHILSHINGG